MPQHSRFNHFESPKLTKPYQGFICIILSNLALACTLDLASKVLRHLTSSADAALPLLVEHSEADICLNTSRERLFGSLSNSPEQPRVARLTFLLTGHRSPLHLNKSLGSFRCSRVVMPPLPVLFLSNTPNLLDPDAVLAQLLNEHHMESLIVQPARYHSASQ